MIVWSGCEKHMQPLIYENLHSKIEMVNRCSIMLKGIQETEQKFHQTDQIATTLAMKTLQSSVNHLKELIDAKIAGIIQPPIPSNSHRKSSKKQRSAIQL